MSRPNLHITGDEAAALMSIQTDFASLLIQPQLEDVTVALEAWSWLAQPKPPPLFVSAFGDLFFLHENQVAMLDTLEGGFDLVAPSIRALRRDLDQSTARDKYLTASWTEIARERGLTLAPGECYDWKLAPIVGGEFSFDALVKFPFKLKVRIAGQLHRQVKDLPPGTNITGFKFVERD